MIPREILKKIRQIEIRTNRIVTISLSVFQLFRVAARVEERQNPNAGGFNQEVDHKRKTPEDNRTPDSASDFWKPFGVLGNTLKVLLNCGSEFLSQTLALSLIPRNGVVKLPFRNATKDKAAFHLRYFASSFALTSSHETT